MIRLSFKKNKKIKIIKLNYKNLLTLETKGTICIQLKSNFKNLKIASEIKRMLSSKIMHRSLITSRKMRKPKKSILKAASNMKNN